MTKETKGKAPSQKADDKDIHSEQTLEEVRDTPVSINHPPGSVSIFDEIEEDELVRTYEPGGELVKIKLPRSSDEVIEEEKRTAEQDKKLATQKPEEVWKEEQERNQKHGKQDKKQEGKDHGTKKHK